MEKFKEVKSIYGELQGYIKNLPQFDIYDQSYLKNYNSLIEELNKITGKNYDRFNLELRNGRGGSYINVNTFKYKLGGLISKLHAEYFNEEVNPFTGVPSTVINQNQNQTTNIQILLEFQSEIDKKLSEYGDGTKEKGFLEKLKSSLSYVRNINQLLQLILKVGTEMGLTAEQIYEIFK